MYTFKKYVSFLKGNLEGFPWSEYIAFCLGLLVGAISCIKG